MAVIKALLLLFLVHLIFVSTEAQKSRIFFRRDYKYLEATEAFYKVHTFHRTWFDAKQQCQDEGAVLFYPEDEAEAIEVVTYWNSTQPFYFVYVGLSDLLVEDIFVTVDGRPILDVYSKWAPGEPNNHNNVEHCVILRRDVLLYDDPCDRNYPFICKKTLETLEWNKECDMPNTGESVPRLCLRCYKFHKNPKSWTEAIAKCSAERSYLAIINSQAEADYFVKLIKNTNRDKVSGQTKNEVFLGFHNRDGSGWKTIKGTTTEDTGFSKWDNQQPDEDKEGCGTMLFQGTLNDVPCSQ